MFRRVNITYVTERGHPFSQWWLILFLSGHSIYCNITTRQKQWLILHIMSNCYLTYNNCLRQKCENICVKKVHSRCRLLNASPIITIVIVYNFASNTFYLHRNYTQIVARHWNFVTLRRRFLGKQNLEKPTDLCVKFREHLKFIDVHIRDSLIACSKAAGILFLKFYFSWFASVPPKNCPSNNFEFIFKSYSILSDHFTPFRIWWTNLDSINQHGNIKDCKLSS